jgi:hypothetical protein
VFPVLKDQAPSVIAAAVLVLVLFALAGVLLVPPGPESTQRLGLLFGVIGTAVAAFVAMLKSAQAAANTNGKLDARIEAAVHRANAARRRGDEPKTADELERIR